MNSLFINCTHATTHGQGYNLTKSWLGDTGAQCHVLCAPHNETGHAKHKIKMGSKSSSNVLRYKDVTICNKNNQNILLKNTRVVKGMAMNIISLLQLVE